MAAPTWMKTMDKDQLRNWIAMMQGALREDPGHKDASEVTRQIGEAKKLLLK